MLARADALHMPVADGSVHMCVTSPPYYQLRDYGIPGQLGMEDTPAEYIEKMVSVFREVWRVMRPEGTLWVNIGDSYSNQDKTGGSGGGKNYTSRAGGYWRGKRDTGVKQKDLLGIPWMLAFALRADGWYLRSDIIWAKPNPMPESVTDRPTKSHEYLFLLAKQERYFYDAEAVKEPIATSTASDHRLDKPGYEPNRPYRAFPGERQDRGAGLLQGQDGSMRNKRSVWTIPTNPYPGAHFATFPPALVEPCILAGTSAHGCCSACGVPWERVTETQRNGRDWNANNRAGGDRLKVGQSASGAMPRDYRSPVTLGWSPTCDHDAPTVPAVVLDPFCGSGTTGEVARLHGRRFVGLDLNGAYLTELALPRAEQGQSAASMARLPLFAQQVPA